ncbi:DUF2510 domain-containing protein [Microbacterium foliorum]|uniref:DUF2510 domain-containing protein n=1 Tax=Microbacterium foliorum TaxID=104336 RepID=A0A0F0KEP9_9MICO|nr:DUF2510 domain-containing protein [Microbacterium foliorum]AXL11141.1 DUF2510 domain-containing protein [Microbacterium foliorum]KJL19328.1 hypothetical protein RN50_02613 [Microbacterium foliorum]
MSMPAGWYDDGSGRQRWWDGEKWSEHVAPEQSGGSAAAQPPTGPSAPSANGYAAATTGPPSSPDRVAPVLGFVGLGLAVLGTVLACIPVTFVVGVVVLIAAFVVSLVGVFTKNTAKWPSIVGMVLSVIGGVIGTIVTLVIVAAALVGPTGPMTPTVAPPTPSISAQPSSEPSPSSPPVGEERPSAEALGAALLADLQRTGITDYDNDPEFVACWGEFVYASELSDEALLEYVDTLTITGSEADLMKTVSTDATVSCSTP